MGYQSKFMVVQLYHKIRIEVATRCGYRTVLVTHTYLRLLPQETITPGPSPRSGCNSGVGV